MKSSKNPKVLNYIIRNMLDPILQRLESLKIKEEDYSQFLRLIEKQADENNQAILSSIEKYLNEEKDIRHLIDSNNSLLTGMIRAKLYNPNIMDEEGTIGHIVPDTPLLSDKSLTTVAYGFIKDGVSILLAGAVNKGIITGHDENLVGEYDFYNPFNNKFPSFYPNEILKTSKSSALIATNNGLVDFDIALNTYRVRTSSYGLNTNIVKCLAPLANMVNEKIGYLAGTSKGVSFSPTGIRWLNVDKSFTREVTVFNSTQKRDDLLKSVFIGTARGLYYFNAASYIANPDTYKISFLEGITESLPSYYINGISYDAVYDTLYVATDSGVGVIKSVSGYLEAGDFTAAPPLVNTYNRLNGLSSSLCFDICVMPNHKVFICTANGLTVTSDFNAFTYVTKHLQETTEPGLNSYMCSRIIRKNNSAVTVLHPIGFTEGLYA
jgi:hypothetical protein